MRPNAPRPTGFESRVDKNRVAEVLAEGGVDFRYFKTAPGVAPAGVDYSRSRAVFALGTLCREQPDFEPEN